MLLRVDIHLHTIHSGDSFIEPQDAMRRAKEVGLQGVAFTDHDSIESYKSIPKDTDIAVIPGIEVSSSKGHILGLGLSEMIPKGLSPEETVDHIHSAGGLAVASHVMRLSRNTLQWDTVRKLKLDGLETVNSGALVSWRFRASRQLAMELNVPQLGGSDAHILGTIGRAFTLLQADSDAVEDVLKAIRRGHTAPQGRTDSLSNRLARIGFLIKRKASGLP